MIKMTNAVINEVKKVVKGKDDIIRKVLMAIYASGHVLLEDNPGSGKTTLAKAFTRAIDLDYKRQQFTPDTMPSDIIGYTYFNKNTGEMQYMEGSVQCNLFLGDEINRTSAKTQAALLQAMEEKSITVEGVTHQLMDPFIVIATQNPVTSLGTQPLPDSQCDRFIIKLSMGYPDVADEVNILKETSIYDITSRVNKVMSRESLITIRQYVDTIFASDEILDYICRLCDATRHDQYIEVGVSTRGAIAIKRMACAHALMDNRAYVIPEDVASVFLDVCCHRIILKPQAKLEDVNAESLLTKTLGEVKPPVLARY